MGAGLALAFKNKYPKVFDSYQRWCYISKMDNAPHVAGAIGVDKETDPNKFILYFATKTHWQDKSSLRNIEIGLKEINKRLLYEKDSFGYEETYSKIKSMAFPALGCGCGSLSWDIVKPLMMKYLSRLDMTIEIYEPEGNTNQRKEEPCQEKQRRLL
jgi:O-acetyl-ADP-ribose deacetylase (regulator of RNase III)